MTKLRETIDLNDIQAMFGDENQQLSYSEKVLMEDTEKWSMTLKKEILNWGNYDNTLQEATTEYVTNNFNTVIANNEYAKFLYYITGTSVGEHEYIYDTSDNMIYKIAPTKIWRYTVHSLEELTYWRTSSTRENIKNSATYTQIVQNVEIVEVSNLKYYEPDLNGLVQEVTSLVFYKLQDNNITNEQYIMSATEWFVQNKPNQITYNSETYILYDYANKIWANIKILIKGIENNWTWIPRQSYNINGTTSNIVFTDIENNILNGEAGEYEPSPAFLNNTKKGIWVSKYQPSYSNKKGIEEIAELPDLTGLDPFLTYLAIYDDEGNIVDTVLYNEVKDNMDYFIRTQNWYSYKSQRWANIKIIDNGIETWWTWIPRYAYFNQGETTNVLLVNVDNKRLDGTELPDGYELAPAFVGNTKKGVWISKYQPSSKVSQIINEIPEPPDLTGLDASMTYLAIYNETGTKCEELVLLSTVQNNIEQFAQNNNWYDYDNKQWANIKIVDNGVETWWTWIPRYAYFNQGETTNVLLVNVNNKRLDGTELPDGYELAPAFVGNTKKGVWISKYQPSQSDE